MALTVNTAFADTWKQEVLEGIHLFKSSAGSTFKMLLLKAAAAGSGTYGTNTTNVGTPGSGSPTNANVGTDETTDTSGNGQYVSGGFTMTANANPGLDTSAHIAYISWSTNPNWGPSATITSRGAVLYNSSAGGNAVAAFNFGSDIASTLGTFTVVLPTNNSSSAIIRLT
jgi:hypothetical protein